MAPNIRRLSYIMAVTQHGSLAEAAKKLNVSPSAISVAIKDCEAALGFQIFSCKPSRALPETWPVRLGPFALASQVSLDPKRRPQ